MIDPRPDLKEDHKYWHILLTKAKYIDERCAGILHGIRCGGGKLEMNDGNLKLKPRIGNPHLWNTRNEWEEDRQKWLLSKKEQFIKIFKSASREISP